MLIFLHFARQKAGLFMCALLLAAHPALWSQHPDCTITGLDTVCAESVAMYHITVSGVTDFQVLWDVPGGTPMTSDNEMIVVHWEKRGSTKVSATLIDPVSQLALGDACYLTIEVLGKPTPKIFPRYLVSSNCGEREVLSGYCAGSTTVFYAVGSGGTYDWTVDGIPHGSGDSISLTLSNPGSVMVCLKETNVGGCSQEVCSTYQVFEPPVTRFTELSHGEDTLITICRGEDLLFRGEYEHPGGFALGSWFWTVRNTSSGTLLGTGSTADFPYAFKVPGTYTVALYASNCLGCLSLPTQVTVVVQTTAVPEILCPSVVCESNAPVEYCAVPVCGSYQWTVNPTDGGHIMGSDTNQCVQVVWDTPLPGGYGFVTLLVQDCPGSYCAMPATVEVPVIPKEQPIEGPGGLCNPNATGVLYQVPYWPGAMYHWTISNVNPAGVNVVGTGNGNQFLVNLNNFSGAFQVNVTIDHFVAGCQSVGSLPVRVQNYGLVVTGKLCYGADVSLQVVSPPATPYQIEWRITGKAYVDTVSNSPDIIIPFTAFGQSGNFTINAKILNGGTAFGCDALSTLVNIPNQVSTVSLIVGPRKICPDISYEYNAFPNSPGQISWQTSTSGMLISVVQPNRASVKWDTSQGPDTLTAIRIVDGWPFCAAPCEQL